MFLYYDFEIECDVQYDEITHRDRGWFEPHYHKELVNVSYSFYVDVKFKDFFDFMKPFGFETWKLEGQASYERACRDVFDSNWFDLDSLEDDEEFQEFMNDRYYEQALEECKEEYC